MAYVRLEIPKYVLDKIENTRYSARGNLRFSIPALTALIFIFHIKVSHY
jgi:hypothetical protein